MSEILHTPRPIEVIYAELEQLEPKPIRDFVPSNADEEKQKFLAGTIRNPRHVYEKLASTDFMAQVLAIEAKKRELQQSPLMIPRHSDAYVSLADNYLTKLSMMSAAHSYNTTEGEQQQRAADYFMRANIELYGEPEVATYHGLVGEARQRAAGKQMTGRLAEIRDEFMATTPEVGAVEERFKPSQETIELAQRAAQAIYGRWFEYAPDRDEKYTAADIAAIFQSVITNEFGASAAGWEVELTDEVKAISVSASEKRVKVPVDRQPSDAKKVRGLLVHELGVHMTRSIMGASLDIEPLRVGLPDYGESEEGLARVMEMTVMGKIEDAGVPYYLGISAAYFDGKDFRDVYEMLWRHAVLTKDINSDDETLDAEVAKSQDLAYRQTLRIFRGTDELPWFKDLSYYNGTMKVWEYLERQGGDITTFLMLFMGKADPDNERHRRILLSAQTKV